MADRAIHFIVNATPLQLIVVMATLFILLVLLIASACTNHKHYDPRRDLPRRKIRADEHLHSRLYKWRNLLTYFNRQRHHHL
jgi:hypothetical protein